MKLVRNLVVLATATLTFFFCIACNKGGTSPAGASGSGNPQPLAYKNVNCGNPDGCIVCPQPLSKTTCQLSITVMKNMESGGTHLPILLHHKDKIVWFGDNGETITVSDLTGANCKDESKNPKAPPVPTENLTFNNSDFVIASVKDDKKYDDFCYKHNITYTDSSGKSNTIDPHIYIGQ